MSDATSAGPRRVGGPAAARTSLLVADARTKRRNAAEARFRAYGVIAIAVAMLALFFLMFTILRDGSGAFWQTYVKIPVAIDAAVVDPKGNRDPSEMDDVLTMSYAGVLQDALARWTADNGVEIEGLKAVSYTHLRAHET